MNRYKKPDNQVNENNNTISENKTDPLKLKTNINKSQDLKQVQDI